MNDKQKYFGSIIADKSSGSGDILKRFIITLDIFLKEVQCTSKNEFSSLLKSIEADMACFAIIRHFIKHVILELNKDKSKTNVNDLAKKQITKYLKQWKDIHKTVANEVVSQLKFKNKRVLLHSHSSFVLEAFYKLKQKGIMPEVYQTLSSPVNEGIIQAKKLAENGFSVKLICDAAIGRFIKEVDFCITGADAIYTDYYINKTGTLQIGLLCKHFSKSLFVITDSRKYINEKCSSEVFCEPERTPEEVLKNPPKGVVPLNFYFEMVPNNLVSRFIFNEDT